MNENELDILAPIVPNHKLGNIELDKDIMEYKNLISSFSWLDKDTLCECSATLFSSFHVGYEMQGVLIMIFEITTGKLERICALEGYKGVLFDKIKVGMSLKQVALQGFQLIFDEVEELYFLKNVKGVSIEADVNNKYIEKITIYKE